MKQGQHGLGTIRTLRDEDGRATGYRALLPRHLSRPPTRSKNRNRYQEAVGPVFVSPEEARSFLNAAIAKRRAAPAADLGLPFSHFVEGEIRARKQTALRTYGNEARANLSVAGMRSTDSCWLSRTDFYSMPARAIGKEDVQRFVDWLETEAVGQSGKPLSANWIRNTVVLIGCAFDRAGVSPNPVRDLRLPEKHRPDIVHMDLAAQRKFFAAEAVELADRVMVGCGMGSGLRVGELLSIERSDVHAYDRDPHLVVRYGGNHHAPTKGRRVRRVELFEPGLGFWRLWLERFAPHDGVMVFPGPKGGYAKHWPDQFPGWATISGVKDFTSHVMRHTYAVALLSGSWGYEPRTMEFVSQQLGHTEITTTQRYYAAFEAGTWSREVRRMTGRGGGGGAGSVVTAESLLGIDAGMMLDGGGAHGILAMASGSELGGVESPSLTRSLKNKSFSMSPVMPEHQSIPELARGFLERVRSGDPTAVARGIELASRVLAEAAVEDAESLPAREGVAS